jgi:hypothetical protein
LSKPERSEGKQRSFRDYARRPWVVLFCYVRHFEDEGVKYGRKETLGYTSFFILTL